MHGAKVKYRVLVRKTEGKRLLGMTRQRVEGNIKMLMKYERSIWVRIATSGGLL
jgi:hypothetical protein